MLEQILEEQAASAVASLYGEENADIQIQKTRPEFEGEFTVVVFPLTRFSKKGPEDTGAQLGDYLVDHVEEVTAYNVVKGFLNLTTSDSYWIKFLSQAHSVPGFGAAEQATGRKIMVEYSSPNTNKPLHLGHLRNIFLGYSVSNILKAAGNEVVKVQIINDRGIHICKSMLAWQRFGDGETPESSGLKGDKLTGKYYVKFDEVYKEEIASLVAGGMEEEEAAKNTTILDDAQEMLRKWEAQDKDVVALWKKMNSWVYDGFDITYRTMGVDFDQLYYESETFLLGRDKVLKGVEDGVFYKNEDGSVWCDLTDEGLDQKILLRSDGTAVYMTQDIGTAIQRFEDHKGLNQLIYTVGNEQDYHFKVLFLILQKLGYRWAEECFHLSYGMVDLPTGKMKSREGTVVDADDLMAEMIDTAKAKAQELGKLENVPEQDRDGLYSTVGLGALKYFLLRVDARKGILFDPEESIQFEGNTGPFIQYTHARICSILKGQEMGDLAADYENGLEQAERSVLLKLHEYPAVIQEAASLFSPAIVASYVYDLVKAYNHFYQTITILKEEDVAKRNMRLILTEVTGRVINSGMGLLGISVPQRM